LKQSKNGSIFLSGLRGRTIVDEEGSLKARPPAIAAAQISLKTNAIKLAGATNDITSFGVRSFTEV
jgi:hypothetical protein